MGSLLYHEDYTPCLYLNVKNKPYKIHRIHFYNDDGVICSMNYFDDNPSFYYGNGTNLRRKMNMDRKENFIIKSKIPAYSNEYDLYICYENTDIKYQGKVIKNSYCYNSEDVVSSRLYKKYLIGDYTHFEYVTLLSGKKSRLMNKIELIIKKELLDISNFRIKPKKGMDEILKRISKLNERTYWENERLILREKLQK